MVSSRDGRDLRPKILIISLVGTNELSIERQCLMQENPCATEASNQAREPVLIEARTPYMRSIKGCTSDVTSFWSIENSAGKRVTNKRIAGFRKC